MGSGQIRAQILSPTETEEAKVEFSHSCKISGYADMQGETPVVSIIIPCYNNEHYVGKAIQSALNQSYEDKEVIVIDDGSTDDSLNRIRSFDEQITWRTQPNAGAPASRNYGLRLASGKYVKFLDADDMLLEEAIATQVAQAARCADAECVVVGDIENVDADEKFLSTSNFRSIREGEDPIAYILSVNPQICAPLHCRALLKKIKGFDEKLLLAQEYDLHLRLYLNGTRFCYFQEPVAKVRWHDGVNRITNNRKTHVRVEDTQRVRERAKKIISAGQFTEPVRRKMARVAWRSGRSALRQGQKEAGRKHFELAASWHRDCIAGSSDLYRWCAYLFGPSIAERVGAWGRSVKKLLKAVSVMY